MITRLVARAAGKKAATLKGAKAIFMKKPRASPRGAPVTLLGRLSSRATFSSLVSMARPGREEIVRQFYAGSGRGQGWRWDFLVWHSQCCGSQPPCNLPTRRRKPRQRHSSPLLESSCPKPSPAGQARPATSIHTCAPKVRPFFSRPPPQRGSRLCCACGGKNISRSSGPAIS